MIRAGEKGVLHRNRKSSIGLSRFAWFLRLTASTIRSLRLRLLSFAGSNDMTTNARASTRNKDCGIAQGGKTSVFAYFLQGERT